MGNIKGLSGGNVIRAALLCAVLCLPAFSAVPATPVLLSPVNGQTGVAPTPRFSWHKATGASAYRIQFSAHSGFTSLTKDTSGLTDTNYDATQPLHFSKYYWRIRAKNSSGNGNWSNSWILTTEMVHCVWYSSEWGLNSQTKTDTLKYFNTLGYNYVLVYLPYTFVMAYMHYNTSGADAGHWVFNNGKYTDSSTRAVQYFQAFKKAAEACSLHVLPALGDLSHQDMWINGATNSNGDTIWHRCDALSEFKSQASYNTFVNSNHLLAGNDRNSVCWANDSNTIARDVFVEQLKIFQSNWGNTTLGGLYPQYIHIGHDEIGNWSYISNPGKFVCYVGAEKSQALCTSHGGGSVGKAWVIAHEIKTRHLEIDTFCNPGVKMILWGDCFVPLDNGQAGGLTGDQNGNGGVLQFLRDTMKLTNNCIIEPWNYYYVNGNMTTLNYAFNQNAQVQYIQKFGFGYMLASGEGANYSDSNKNVISGGMANVHQHLQVAFEQVRASRFYPNNLYGFGVMLFEDFLNTGGLNDTLVGYTLPILAYFGWTFGDDSLKLSKYNSFTPQVYAKFNPIHSRKNLSWSSGKDYYTP